MVIVSDATRRLAPACRSLLGEGHSRKHLLLGRNQNALCKRVFTVPRSSADFLGRPRVVRVSIRGSKPSERRKGHCFQRLPTAPYYGGAAPSGARVGARGHGRSIGAVAGENPSGSGCDRLNPRAAGSAEGLGTLKNAERDARCADV